MAPASTYDVVARAWLPDVVAPLAAGALAALAGTYLGSREKLEA